MKLKPSLSLTAIGKMERDKEIQIFFAAGFLNLPFFYPSCYTCQQNSVLRC
jgi:hypothetical protein